jgi:hypothetical protein
MTLGARATNRENALAVPPRRLEISSPCDVSHRSMKEVFMKLFFGAFATPVVQELGLPPSTASLERLIQNKLRGKVTPEGHESVDLGGEGIPPGVATQVDLVPGRGVPTEATTSGERRRGRGRGLARR